MSTRENGWWGPLEKFRSIGSPRTLILGFLVVALVLGSALLWILRSSGRFVVGTLDYVVQNLVNVSGMNPNLAKGIVILVTIPFFWAVTKYTRRVYFSPDLRPSLKLYTNVYGIIIVVYVAAFFLTLYGASRSSYFGQTTGEALKWYALTPEGFRFADSPGVDQKYGVPLRPVTPEIVSLIEKRRLGILPRPLHSNSPDAIEFFDPISGDVRVWYHQRSDGSLDLFDNEGFDPSTGEPLQPVTQEIVATLKANAVRLVAEQKEREANQHEAAERNRRDESRARYIAAAASNSPDTVDIAVVVVDADGNLDTRLGDQVAAALAAKKGRRAATTLLKSAFVSDGLFANVLNGEWERARELDLARFVDYLLLGTPRVTFSENPQFPGVFTAHATADFRLVAVATGIVEDHITITQIGAGVSREISEGQALERVVTQVAAHPWPTDPLGQSHS